MHKQAVYYRSLGDLSSESVVSRLVSWVSSCFVLVCFWLGFGFWLCLLCLVLGDIWPFALALTIIQTYCL